MDNSTLNFIISIFVIIMSVIGMFYTFTLIFEAITGYSHNKYKKCLRTYEEINALQEKRIEHLKKLNNYLFEVIEENREMGNEFIKRFIENWHNIKK